MVPILKALEPHILAGAQGELPGLMRYLKDEGVVDAERLAVVDIGFGGTIQGYLNKILAKQVHGYYLMTETRADAVAEKYGVFLKGCFADKIAPSLDAPVMFRRSFIMEKLLSCNDPQIVYYDATSDESELLKIYRDLAADEIKPAELRDQIHLGAIAYAQDAARIREQAFPAFKPSVGMANAIIESFLNNLCEEDVDFLSHIILDDFYCGRELVS